MYKEDKRKAKPYKAKQGEIYYVFFPKSCGSVQHGVRPAIITQNNRLNRNSTTYVCAMITSKLKRLDLPEHIILPKTVGLPRRSMVLVEQRATVDRSQLISYRGQVDQAMFNKIARAIRACEKPGDKDYDME